MYLATMECPKILWSYIIVSIFLLYPFHCGHVKGAVTLSPPGVAPVCNGGQLELTCTTAGRFLRWRFTVIRGNETITIIRTIQAAVPAGDAISHLTLNSTMFNFSRTSSEGSLPLTSKLVIGPVSSNLNGTVMNCIDLVSSNLSSTTIVVREREPLQNNPGPTVYIQIESENLERDGVIVILEWTQENNSYYSYNVSVIPYPVSTLNPEGMRAQLNVSYNVRYNVSVVATPIINCGQGNDNTVTASIELHYATCQHPVEQVNASIILSVLDYTEPVLSGTNVTLGCSAGMRLTGPATLTCMGNGEWEPDPNKVECKNKSVILIGRGSSQSPDGKIAVASSVTVFAVASIVFFTVGFLCGHFCQKKRKSNRAAAAAESVPPLATDGEQAQIPYYDDVVLQQEVVELKDNVAYGPIQ